MAFEIVYDMDGSIPVFGSVAVEHQAKGTSNEQDVGSSSNSKVVEAANEQAVQGASHS